MKTMLIVFDNAVNDIGLCVGPYIRQLPMLCFQCTSLLPFTWNGINQKRCNLFSGLKTFDTFLAICQLNLIMIIFRIWVMRGQTRTRNRLVISQTIWKKNRLILEFDRFRAVWSSLKTHKIPIRSVCMHLESAGFDSIGLFNIYTNRAYQMIYI